MENFVKTFSNLKTNCDIDDISDRVIKIKIKKCRDKYISFIPVVIGPQYDNNNEMSIKLGVFNLYLSSNCTFELYNEKNVSDIELAIISIFNISFHEILKIKKIKISNVLKIYYVFFKNTKVIKDTISEKWMIFFRFGPPLKRTSVVLKSSQDPLIILKVGDVIELIK